MVKASVIILNYNGSRFLDKLFETLSNQTFKDLEVIFLDNASTDDGRKVLKKALNKTTTRQLRVRVIGSSMSLGFCRGNNTCLRLAEGEYIMFLNNAGATVLNLQYSELAK